MTEDRSATDRLRERAARARAAVRSLSDLEGLLRTLDERQQQRHEELLEALRGFERRSRRSLPAALELEASRSSAQFALQHMPSARHYVHPHDLLRQALADAPADGMVLELGVATGTTLQVLVEGAKGRPVFGFDSFEGLPERWREGYDPGEFAMAPPVVPGAELVVGWFEDVLPGFFAEHSGPISLLHVDCDLYSSTVTVLEHAGPRLVPGSVVVFDEFFNYPWWQQHEYKAWEEYLDRTGTGVEYLGLAMDEEQVSLRITAVPSA